MGTNGSSRKQRSRADRLALAVVDGVTRRPWSVIAISVLLTALAACGGVYLEFSNNYRVFFSPENPELVAFEKFQATYTKNDNILFILQPQRGDAFSPRLADAVETITEESWQIPYAIRVDSVTNFQHSWADGDDLTVEDLIRNASSLPEDELRRRRAIALAEPLLRGNLISADADTTGINVTLQYPEESLTEVPEAVAHARALADRVRSEYPDVRVALSGVSMLNNAFAEAGQRDSLTLFPLMFAVLSLFMVVVLRSWTGTFSTLAVIGLSSAAALGLAGYAGIELTPISVTAPVIILTLAIADSVHILVSMLDQMRSGLDRRIALRESIRINFLPVVITSVTTILGFLTLNFSDAPPYRHLGVITAMGIGVALLLSLTLLPAMLTVLPLRVQRRARTRRGLQERMEEFGGWVSAHYRPILAVFGSAAVALALLVPAIDLNDEFVKYFDEEVTFRQDAEFGVEHLNGIYLIEYSMEAGEPGGISDPVYLANLSKFTEWLRRQPEVKHVYSYTDVIERLNKNMHGDDPAWSRIPEDREMAAQYLLLYELSLPYGLDLNDRINIDKSSTRLTASVGDMSTVEIRRFLDRAGGWLARNVPEAMRASPTGAAVMFSYISQRNIESMLRGNVVAVLLIAAVMILALRNLPMGLLSLLPNAIPILMTFGIWAVAVNQVGMSAAMVSVTSLGIVVDDTVHFLIKYLRARQEGKLDRIGAVRYAFRTVGVAMASTTIILAFGFSVLALSSFRLNAEMGLLMALAVIIALGVDFLLLPSLLLIGHRKEAMDLERRKTMKSAWRKLGKTAAVTSAGGLLVIGLMSTLASPAVGLTPEQQGYELAARSDRSDRGFGNSSVEVQMILRNKAGKETSRSLSVRTLEVPAEDTGDKSLIVFDSPADIDGTALLSHAKILDPDDQWLYLPALKRVKRISSVNKSGPFVGSEFAFEDFTSLELNKYDYRYLRTEPCGALLCDVVDRFPRYEHSGYTHQVSWVDQEAHQIRKVEFYDRRGELLKTLTLEDYRQYDDRFWRPHLMRMSNHLTGKSTDLIYSDYHFGGDLHEDDFVKGALQRIH